MNLASEKQPYPHELNTKNLSHLQHSLIINKFRLHGAIFSATHQVNVSTITKRRYSIKM